MNVRLPDLAVGDLRAQVTAVTTGERRFLELVERYGADAVAGSINAIMDHSDAEARAKPARSRTASMWPKSFMDDDGLNIGQPVPIRVKVIVEERTGNNRFVRRQPAGQRLL